MKYKIVFSIIFILVYAQAYTQLQSDTLRFQIENITIKAPRITIPLKENPSAATVVSPAVLTTMPRSIAVDEALRLVPSVRIDNQANGSRVHMSIRGQGILTERGIRGIKILLDGIPVNDPTGFAPDFYDVDWATVSRIEVLRGPSAALYGGGSNAGVIYIETASGADKPFGGTVYGSAGSNGFYKTLGQITGTANNLDYRVSASHLYGAGYRDHTAFYGNNISEKINWKASDKFRLTQVTNITQYFNENAEGLNLGQFPNFRQANPDAIPLNEYQKTNRFTTGAVGQVDISETQNVQFNSFLRWTGYKEPGSSAVQYRDFKSPGGTVQYNFQLGSGAVKHNISIGTDLQWQTIKEYRVPNIKNAARTKEDRGDISEIVQEDDSLLSNQTITQRGIGGFLLDRVELTNNLSFLLSVRYDNIHNALRDELPSPTSLSGTADFKKATARVGATYSVTPAFNLYANWGQGFLPPATEELANNPAHYGGFNKDLISATSWGQEIGTRGLLTKYIYYDITGFSLNTDNDFYRYRILPARPLETFYGNMGSTSRYGFEMYAIITPLPKLNVQAAYTYSHFKYTKPDSIDGNWLPNSPQHQLVIDAEYKITDKLSIGFGNEMQSMWYIYFDPSHKDVSQDGFNLLHARITYHCTIGKYIGEFSIYGKNLTNKQYIAFTEPDPDGNSYQPSARREIFGSIKINF